MSAGAIAGGVVGGVVGFFVGGPAGAAIGFGIGMSAGGMLDPVKGPSQPGPQLSDKNFQTAKYGDMLARFYGTIAVAGNVTWIENGKLKVRVRKKKSGGKGGGSAKAAPVAYYSATFFLSLGIGPIAGIRRIWCSDKLIYNAGSDDLETIIASNQAASGWKLYRGTDDQLPDPRYEADVGVGNALAYRGEAYIAFYDFQLADFGNSLQGAQFKVEVVTFEDVFSPAVVLSEQIPAGTYRGFAMPATFAGGLYGYLYNNDSVYQVRRSADPLPAGSFASANQWARRCVGSVKYAYMVGFTLHTDKRSFASMPNLSNFEVFVDGDYVLFFGLQHSLRVPAENVALVDGTLLSAFYYQGEVFSLHDTGVVARRNAADLTVLDSVTITLPSQSGGTWPNGVFLSVDDEYLWLGPNTAGAATHVDRLYGYSRETGELLVTYEGIPYISVGTVGNPNAVIDGLMVLGGIGSPNLLISRFTKSVISTVPLADIVEAEIELSSLLTAADIDTSLLTAEVRGYRVSGGSIRSALEPLQGTWPFDMIQSGYQLKPIPRGQSSVMTIPWQDFGASDGDMPGDLLQESREMDSQLPARTSIKYLDAAREYAIAEQSAARDNTPAINRVDRELPIVLTADEAAGVADVLQNLPWLERSEYAFSLPPIYLALEPGDVLTIVAPWATFELRITEINYAPDGRLECKGRPNRAALYTSNAKGGEGVPPSGEVPLPGMTILLMLDIPVIDETIQNTPGLVMVATGITDGWPGALAFRSIDGGQTWQEIQGFDGRATIGAARGTLPASACTVIDQRSLVVDLIAGELESITRDQLLAGQNYVAYGANGRWEILRFQNATLQGDGSYLLSHFVRGDRGTEWAAGLHQAGDYFVLLDDPDNVFVDMAVGSIGVPATYRGVTAGSSIDSAEDQAVTYQGVNLECLSPVSAQGTRDTSGNLSGRFVRRSRLSSSWWTTGVPAPIGETSEAYEIDVMDGSTVKRTITASTPAFSYSAADQVTDLGSAQASITFRIYQISGVVGRGYPLEVTL